MRKPKPEGEKTQLCDTRTWPDPKKWYPKFWLPTFVPETWGKNPTFLIPKPDPNLRKRTRPEPNFCNPTTYITNSLSTLKIFSFLSENFCQVWRYFLFWDFHQLWLRYHPTFSPHIRHDSSKIGNDLYFWYVFDCFMEIHQNVPINKQFLSCLLFLVQK